MKTSLEKELLQYGLIIGIIYQFYQIVISLFPVFFQLNALVNITITLVLIFQLFLVQKGKYVQPIAFVTHVMAFSACTFFWRTNGGLAGSVPTFLCVYGAFVVTTTHGRYLLATIGLFAVMLIVFFRFYSLLGMHHFYEPEPISSRQMSLDFVVIGIVIVVFVLFLKRQFFFYRTQVQRRHEQLKQIAHTLHQQNQELATREEETRAINDNLEQLVHDRTREMEDKNKALSEFAFINAHMLRGPLCRIVGLLQLMERDSAHNTEQVKALRKITNEIDAEISGISKLLN